MALKRKTVLSSFVHECVCVYKNKSDRDKQIEKQKVVNVCIEFDGEWILATFTRKWTLDLDVLKLRFL